MSWSLIENEMQFYSQIICSDWPTDSRKRLVALHTAETGVKNKYWKPSGITEPVSSTLYFIIIIIFFISFTKFLKLIINN